MKKPSQVFNQAMIGAINSSNKRVLELIQACIDQFFLTTATGKYLVQLGEQEGFVMPANSGLDIRAYRVLVPLMVSSPKQVRKTFEETIEAFYGSDRTRPSVTSTMPSPYSLSDGDDIQLLTEKGVVKIGILASSVSNIASVTSSELAAVINTAQVNAFADSVTNRITGEKFMRLTSTTSGAMAFIQIVGGTAQNIIRFPNLVQTEQKVGTTWLVSKDQAYSDIMKIQISML